MARQWFRPLAGFLFSGERAVMQGRWIVPVSMLVMACAAVVSVMEMLVSRAEIQSLRDQVREMEVRVRKNEVFRIKFEDAEGDWQAVPMREFRSHGGEVTL
jgi:ribosomal protein L10